MKKLLRITAAVVTSLSLTAGAGGAVFANSASIGTTGPDSYNKVEFRNSNSHRVSNDTDLWFTNNNPQSANSGDVSVRRNTTGGDASSGMAKNDSLLRVNASVDNSGSCGCVGNNVGSDDSGDINLTGPDSVNKIVFNNSNHTSVNNDTDVHITNNNAQSANSGNVNASRNTTVGDASSGDAVNVSTTEVTLSVIN